jgi:tetratricopeptide (TPR) repeat protein
MNRIYRGVFILRSIAVFLAASAFALAAPAFAADTPTYAAAPAWVVSKDGPLPAGDAATPWLLSDQQVLIEADKRSTFADHAYRIASADALRSWNDLQFVWQPDRDDLIVHRLEIVRDGATIDLLAQGLKLTVLRRETGFEQKAIDGLLTATAPIEDLRVGDTVRFAVTTVERSDVLAGNGEAIVDIQAKPAAIAQGSIRVLWPKALPVKWKSFGKGISPVVQDKGGYTVLTQVQPVIKQDEMPADAPLRYQRPPGLEFSTFPAWSDLSRTMAPLYATAGKVQDGGTLEAAIDKIAKAGTDPKMRAALALALVQNEVRYLYNGLANGNYVPQAPEQTWSLRYGDCKAKTLLLLAILDRLGIAAQPALVNSAIGDALPDRLPTLGAFDHVVVRTTIDGTEYWLDGTTAGTHVEDLADVPPFRYALPLTTAGQDLSALPVRRPARPDLAIAIAYDQSAGTAFPPLFDLDFTMRGELAARLAGMKAQATPDQLREFTQTMLAGMVNNGQIHTRTIEIDESRGTATIHASGIGNLLWMRNEPRPYLALDGLISDLDIKADRTRAAWREIPVSGGSSRLFVRTVSLKLPARPGFATEGDAQADMTIAGIAMHRDAKLDGARLDLSESMWSSGAEIAVDQLPAARAQTTAARQRALRLRAPQDYPSRVEEIAEAKKSKRLAPLLAAYQKAIDDDPEKANGYINRAVFYEGIFEPRAAIADVSEALKREADADTYLRRAGLYFDVGDFTLSLADTEKALEFDPGSESAIDYKIRLLAEQRQYDEALTLADGQIDAAKDKRVWAGLKADTLGKAGRAEEGVALLDEALVARPGDPMLLNELCWLKGTRSLALESALKDCTRAIELTDNAAQVLDSRAMVYFRLGRLDEARADLEAALKVSPGVPGSLYLRGIIRLRGDDRAGGQADLALARMQNPRIDAEYEAFGIAP